MTQLWNKSKQVPNVDIQTLVGYNYFITVDSRPEKPIFHAYYVYPSGVSSRISNDPCDTRGLAKLTCLDDFNRRAKESKKPMVFKLDPDMRRPI